MDNQIKNNVSGKMNKNSENAEFKQSHTEKKLDLILDQDQMKNVPQAGKSVELNNQNREALQNMNDMIQKSDEQINKNPIKKDADQIEKRKILSNSDSVNEKVTVYVDGSEIEIDDIHVQITNKINQHVEAIITGRVHAGIYDQRVKTATNETEISIKHIINGMESLQYEGLISAIQAKAYSAKNELAVYFLNIKAISHSYLLDVLNKSRSFQNEEKTFDAFLEKIFQDYPKAQFINNTISGQQLEAWILQYNVTDWKLIKQEVSKFEQGLFVDARRPTVQIHFGTPEGKNRGELETYDYTIAKTLHMYSEYSENELEHSMDEIDVLYYTIVDRYAKETFWLGDMVIYQDISLYIAEVFSEIKDNKLYNTYKLASKDNLKRPRLANYQLQGLSIPGKVLDVEKNLLKLHLEIDEEQPIDTAKWFDYATFYATWYGMPEINDIVNLHFPTVDERDAIGINSFKQNPEGGYTRNNEVKTPENTSAFGNKGPIDFVTSASDPAVKLLTTKAGRMIELGPDRICIQYSDGTYIILHDSDGIQLYTNKDIACYAEGEINLDAKQRVHVQAQEGITIQCKSSVLSMSPSKIHVMADDKKIN